MGSFAREDLCHLKAQALVLTATSAPRSLTRLFALLDTTVRMLVIPRLLSAILAHIIHLKVGATVPFVPLDIFVRVGAHCYQSPVRQDSYAWH